MRTAAKEAHRWDPLVLVLVFLVFVILAQLVPGFGQLVSILKEGPADPAVRVLVEDRPDQAAVLKGVTAIPGPVFGLDGVFRLPTVVKLLDQGVFVLAHVFSVGICPKGEHRESSARK